MSLEPRSSLMPAETEFETNPMTAQAGAATALPEAPLAMPVQDLTPAPMAILERWLRARPAVRP